MKIDIKWQLKEEKLFDGILRIYSIFLQYSQPSIELNKESIDPLVGEFQSIFSDLVNRYLPRVSATPIFQLYYNGRLKPAEQRVASLGTSHLTLTVVG